MFWKWKNGELGCCRPCQSQVLWRIMDFDFFGANNWVKIAIWYFFVMLDLLSQKLFDNWKQNYLMTGAILSLNWKRSHVMKLVGTNTYCRLGCPVFETGVFAGVLPLKIFNFLCLEKEFNESNIKNTEGLRTSSDISRRSEPETDEVEERDTFPVKT